MATLPPSNLHYTLRSSLNVFECEQLPNASTLPKRNDEFDRLLITLEMHIRLHLANPFEYFTGKNVILNNSCFVFAATTNSQRTIENVGGLTLDQLFASNVQRTTALP